MYYAWADAVERESHDAATYEPSVMEVVARRTAQRYQGFPDSQVVLGLALPNRRKAIFDEIAASTRPVLADSARVLAARGYTSPRHEVRAFTPGADLRWTLPQLAASADYQQLDVDDESLEATVDSGVTDQRRVIGAYYDDEEQTEERRDEEPPLTMGSS